MAPASFVPISNTVCVMDASGSLGAALVERLLQRGYIVRAAVQSHGDHLQKFKAMGGDDEKRLKIFKCDPFDYQSLVGALKGCSGLFYAFEPPDDQPTYDEYMMEVEVRSAHNVLEACAQVDTIDKFVFTSSVTSVIWREDRQSIISGLDEKYWSDVDYCRKFKLWHALSKTLAEKAAWAMAKDRGVNMVAVNAGLLLGPNLSVSNPYLKGAAEMYEDGVFVTIDMEFLVDAHVYVFEDISSYGRYICFNSAINRPEDAFRLAMQIAPSESPEPQCFEEGSKDIPLRISNKKLKTLMLEFQRGPQESY